MRAVEGRQIPGRRWLVQLVGIGLSAGFILVWARLAMLHLFASSELREALHGQAYVSVLSLPQRGRIVDCRGETIAESVQGVSYGVDPAMVRCAECLCRRVQEVLAIPEAECLERIATAKGRFFWLRRGIWGKETLGLDTLSEPGLVRLRERVRVYPHGDLFLPAVGSVGVDQQGLSGLELVYDSVLRKNPEPIVMRRDARGYLSPQVEHVLESGRRPPTLRTTLDGELQSIVAYELSEGVRRVKAASGLALAIEPSTGAVRAMVVVPTPPRGSAHAPIVSDVYEPGSILKPLIAAAALEQGLLRLSDTLFGHHGVWDGDGYRIVDEHPLGYTTLREALAWSSNVIFAKVAQGLSPRLLYRYIRDFGCGLPTGIELPGEAPGIVPKPHQFQPLTALFWGFGYGLAVTPLQLACAYAAIANDGVLMRPYLVEAVLDPDGTKLQKFSPQPVRRVLTVPVAQQLRQLLRSVVEEGTGRPAYLAGIAVAGKTGTAQQLVGGQYSREHHTASFVALFPADRPRLVLLVMLLRPQGGGSGGHTAAPVVRRILQRMMAHPRLSWYVAPNGTA
ncbi:MAG: penicillin-binding protein 2 [Candidatus Kapabacteria bacterium]|nr:penicillin-binding protein 2 [Candidatus Kapabacteria bacterium]MDW8011723.1 penicillin-binding protein 2 [Bacteroidota bacterium]